MIKLLTLLSTCTILFGTEINWQKSYNEALDKAKKENKPLMVIITSENCQWCRKLESMTLSDDAIVKRVNEWFITLHVTRDQSNYPKKLTAKMVPMSYFLDTNEKILNSMPGYWATEDYHSILDDALRNAKK